MVGYTRIKRREWYAKGGLSNPRLARKGNGKAWAYFERVV